ncbi:hypothetical protein GIW54_21600 [Pseudomonas proteolytica]|uniref:Uncharacterized protein n=1 Tax=Pseudomonas proteolytica TaxID=219574 RepID=A0AAW5A3H0_9PSED|nr:hypothetical protein [Pseudomonas proteolytica]MCF5059094.1 hypothetical protein [Pseudomonas proteolytica]MCF5103313.1 hypothetical protein [Pseudomonas proteolytica]
MTDYTELQRLAEHHLSLGHAYTVATPSAVLALIAENERLRESDQEATELCDTLSVLLGEIAVAVRGPEEPKSRHGFHDLPSRVKTVVAERDQLRAAISTPESVFINMKSGRIARISLRSAIDLHGEVINGDDAQQIEIARLRTEVAGLRTGYEAYEQVNAELKAENERLERNRDMWKGQVERQAEELTALRKAAERYEWLRRRDLETVHAGGVFAGLTPHNVVLNGVDLDIAIDAALGQGDQS